MRSLALTALAFAAVMIGITIATFALAQATVPAEAPSFLREIWAIVQPLIVLLVSTVGPLLVAWISARLIALLNIQNENQKKDLEQKFSAALHQSAYNALKFAVGKLGVTIPDTLDVGSPLIVEAIDYIRMKNPDAVDAFSLDNVDLAEIIMSKAPDVAAVLAQARKAAR
jgi:hypothetical protein